MVGNWQTVYDHDQMHLFASDMGLHCTLFAYVLRINKILAFGFLKDCRLELSDMLLFPFSKY